MSPLPPEQQSELKRESASRLFGIKPQDKYMQMAHNLSSLPTRISAIATSKMSSKPILQLNSCLVRAYNEGDVESLAKAANNPRIARWMSNAFPQPYTVQDAKKWISIANTPSPVRDFAICRLDGSAVIGGIGLKARDDINYRTMEIGYWICEDYWHQGIATEVVTAFSNWAFDNFKQLLRLEAIVFEGNPASGHVLIKSGFQFESRQRAAVEKLGRVMDTLTYTKFAMGNGRILTKKHAEPRCREIGTIPRMAFVKLM